MSLETALLAVPSSVVRLMFMPTDRTLATCSSFRASEAHDVSLLAFVGEITDILPVFPQTHALILMPPFVLITHSMRIADKERSNVPFNTKIDDFARRLMALIANTPLGTSRELVLGALQLLPSS